MIHRICMESCRYTDHFCKKEVLKLGLFRRKKQTAGKPSAPQKPVSLPQTGAPEPEQLSEQQARVMAQALSEYLKGKR